MFAQTGCSISIHGDTKNVTGHSPGQSVPADCAWAEGWARWSQEVASSPSDSVICLSFKVLIVYGTYRTNILLNIPL